MIKNYRKPLTITYTVTSAEATATQVLLTLTAGPKPTNGLNFVGQVRRAGVEVPFTWTYATATGILTVANGTGTLTTGDIITVICDFAKLSA